MHDHSTIARAAAVLRDVERDGYCAWCGGRRTALARSPECVANHRSDDTGMPKEAAADASRRPV